MKVTFEFPDNVTPCAMYLNYVIWDSDGVMKMCARGVDTEDLMTLKNDNNKVLRVGVDKIWGAREEGTAERENDETCL